MESEILQDLLTICQHRIPEKHNMKVRFALLLSAYQDLIDFKIIKVAGTNGKGSVSAMLSSCLNLEGKKIGLFTSPHLLSVTERFRVNDQEVSLSDINNFAEKIKAKVLDLIEKHGVAYTPSFFEVLILIAIELFHAAKVDVAIFEAGVGGETDSVSLLPSFLSLITSIGLDHQLQLGDTIEQIALNKAGIANADSTLILHTAIPESLKSLIAQSAQEKNIQLIAAINYIQVHEKTLEQSSLEINIGEKKWNISPALKGSFQVNNINLVLETLLFLHRHDEISSLNSLFGIERAHWIGRFEVIKKRHQWICDAAHNPHAFRSLVVALNEVSQPEDRLLIFGNSEEKDFSTILKIVSEIAARIYFVDDFHKAIKKEKLVGKANFQSLDAPSKIKEVIDLVMQRKKREIVVIAGSIFMVGKARAILMNYSDE